MLLDSLLLVLLTSLAIASKKSSSSGSSGSSFSDDISGDIWTGQFEGYVGDDDSSSSGSAGVVVEVIDAKRMDDNRHFKHRQNAPQQNYYAGGMEDKFDDDSYGYEDNDKDVMNHMMQHDEDDVKHRRKPCKPTRCMTQSNTCCRRTTTDKVTTYILRRTTTTSVVTSSIVRSTTLTSTRVQTESTTILSLSTILSLDTTTLVQSTTRTVTLPNTTITISRTSTTQQPAKTVVSIVTQQILPCFTQFETCFYNCPYYEIEPGCGSCQPTIVPYEELEDVPVRRHHRSRKPRSHRRRHGHKKNGAAVEKMANLTDLSEMVEAKKHHRGVRAEIARCGEQPFCYHKPEMPPARLCDGCHHQPTPTLYNMGCHNHQQRVQPEYAIANGAGCKPSRVYVLPCATRMCTVQPTFEPIPTCGCWNEPAPITVTITVIPSPTTVTVSTHAPNVFCTTEIVCSLYTPLGM